MKVTSYSASGMAASSMQGSVSTDYAKKRSKAIQKSNKNKSPKKKLNYNPREVRSALLKASKSQSAGKVLAQARGKLANLLRAKGTGQVNESELAAAVVHARRMVRCAQIKVRNLKQEEQLQKKHASEAKSEEQKLDNGMKLRIKQKEQNLKQKVKNAKMQKAQKQARHHQELTQRRRIHRNIEFQEMEDADLEYKRNMGNASNDSDTFAYEPAYYPGEGVQLQISEDGMELTEAQIEQQIEQEMAMMVASELAGGTGMPDASGMALGMAGAAAGGADLAGCDMPSGDVPV